MAKESLLEERAGNWTSEDLQLLSLAIPSTFWDLCLTLLSKCSHLLDKHYPLQEVLSFFTNGVFISGK